MEVFGKEEGMMWLGAHTEGCNMVGYGVAFLGTCTEAPADTWLGLGHNDGCSTPEAEASFHQLINCMLGNGKLASDYRLFGHKQSQDYKPLERTKCPGKTCTVKFRHGQGGVKI
eukprot:TRINITY_DN24332_c0_g1_i1.p1 TRINITY_DN24332_c0_g1~~TRINITY_DN24332_c0_g1_i1.p1  ORF type:complete len:114 (+),score=20.67 TRINITY_DN24332_c0_g1_i1:103-444(+)